MRISVLILLIFIVSGSSSYAISPEKKKFYESITLKYDLGYGFFRGGIVNINFKDTVDSGKIKHKIYLEVRTVGVMDALYKIRDIYESYIDKNTGLPTKAIRNISEGGYKRYNICYYDYVSRSDSTIITSGYSGKVVTQKVIYDILSNYYYLKDNFFSKQFVVGQQIKSTTYFTDEVFPIVMFYEGKKTIKTKYGKIKCLVFSPVTEVGRVFEKEDAMKIYISDDENNYPVLIEFDFFIGSARCELKEIIRN